ncbi:MAG: replicative DNA helicase [Bacilli bacterium]|nr:replicative DNA helicase [Bacilli bacterium]
MVEQPYSSQAERAVLGSMMLSKDAVYEGVARLTEEDFYLRDHKIIFNAIKNTHIRGLEVDIVTVVDQLMLDNKLQELSDANYIYTILEDTISPSTVEQYIRIVQDKTILRYLVNLCDSISSGWNKNEIDDIGDYVSKVENDVLSITRSRNVGDFKSPGEVIEVIKEKLVNTDRRTGKLTGTPSGYTDLDRITNGFQPGDLIILAARPSMGKTALALNFAMNASIEHNYPVGVFSLEMPAEQLMQRMLSATSGVNSDKIRSFNLTDKEWPKIDIGVNKIAKSKIYIDDTAGAKIADIQSKAKKLKAKHDDLGLIVIDYLQLITTSTFSKSDNRQQEVSEISRALKAMARDLKVPVIALSQLSRTVEKREDKRPMLSDLRESGAIEQDADLVMFIYRDDYYNQNKGEENQASTGVAQISIAKHRNGATGGIELLFLKDVGLFSNYTKREE